MGLSSSCMTDRRTQMVIYTWVGLNILYIYVSYHHLGHALNKVVKDIINRFHLTQGRKIQ